MVKILNNLIPVCCHCWRVRNEAGKYIDIGADGPDMFHPKACTHTLCPGCVRELYPKEIADKVLGKEGTLERE